MYYGRKITLGWKFSQREKNMCWVLKVDSS